MPRYIDADALIPDLYSRRREIPHQIDGNTDWYLQGFNVGIVHAVIAVENAPTVSPGDVRGVGKWTNKRTIEHDGEWWCTACGKEITIYMGVDRKDRYNYCPNCGAKMEVSEDA